MTIVRNFQSFDNILATPNKLPTVSTTTRLKDWNNLLNASARLESTVADATLLTSFYSPEKLYLTVTTSGGALTIKNLTVFPDKYTSTSYIVTSKDGATSWEVQGNFTFSPTYEVSGNFTSGKLTYGLNTSTPYSYEFSGNISETASGLVTGFVEKITYQRVSPSSTYTANYSLTDAVVGVDYAVGGLALNTTTRITSFDTIEKNSSGVVIGQTSFESMPTVTANTNDLLSLILAGNDTIINTGNGNHGSYSGYGGNDTIIGDAGNNYFANFVDASGLSYGLGNDTVDGGAGYDYVLYGSNKSIRTYGFSNFDSARQSVTVSDFSVTNGSGADRLINIEEIQFSDKVLTWTELSSLISAPAAQGASFGFLLYGAPSADGMAGSNSNDLIYGVLGNDTILGFDGSDTIVGGAGNDSINGGSGIDTSNYTGVRSNFNITNSPSGFTLTDKTGAEGADTLVNVERIKFADTNFALDVVGVGGQVYRIYQAAFDRKPDLVGLGYWMSMMDKGMSLKEVAGGFAGSPEFSAVFGANPGNAQIVNNFYQNVLHRAGDPVGLAFWVDVLDSKRDTVAGVLAGFSESPENQAALLGVIGNGFAYTFFG